MNDSVNKPHHYQVLDGIEAVDIIRARLTEEEFRGWCKGNALKYMLRAGLKDDEGQDVRKGMKFMGWLAEMLP